MRHPGQRILNTLGVVWVGCLMATHTVQLPTRWMVFGASAIAQAAGSGSAPIEITQGGTYSGHC